MPTRTNVQVQKQQTWAQAITTESKVSHSLCSNLP